MAHIDLTGKKALVTGGSQGIGAQICKELASCGASVLINYRQSASKAEQLAQDISASYGVDTHIFQADISNRGEIEAMFQFMDSKFRGIDILINNAGVESNNHILELPEKDWDLIQNVNLKAPFFCAQQAGLRMESSNGGVIINISSIHDTIPRKGLAHYCAAKAGLKMLTRCLALELAESNIRVLTVSPGAIETEMNREEIADFGKEKFQGWIPQGRIGDVADIAPTIAFLCSEMASYMTGTELYIDGAYMQSTIPYDPRPPRKK